MMHFSASLMKQWSSWFVQKCKKIKVTWPWPRSTFLTIVEVSCPYCSVLCKHAR